ncbi:exodeoxyribonuclease VII, large subunit [Nautilia profundicola AmH]|uniref:Exodeoxyribonuclease 7 large subunit n=1 Tax=Nautilia profundicola (strain ATCC BAA-1463 / DSM 18972 / AmH) TaxID=598659 RepID=EX7L_NAUPA|nr:exodeoxyribonuclease VII large subunit [Nautilia profundicola]B9L5W5.1 RecName: Full=Exodeoxyribonuclease 7 large subunit; AltName: Full=Exodeoxyribonuclease VII large subunit; Short=Exonuclease VII large subunit [Nautilia profundicola AmH]ACM93262.1 exodeoxyribonuclease VII, large subunit [Nautilia profundicola AmH]
MTPISVTQLNNQIKSIVESHFEIVLVEGEISKVVYHSSGHLYFTLKDENSSINCAMWKSNLTRMKFRLKEGEKVYVYGALSVYVPRGEYKIIAQSIEPSGVGALQKAFEQLKEELSKLGYFDEARKKSIPRFPRRIAIVTSATGAALQDMLRVAGKRWQLTEIYLFNALVQGDGAAEDIAMKIKLADEFVFEDGSGFDLIIIGRGGGSKEDLWPFNERVVADAVYNASTPIISAVGHEIDYLISDFVADVRAATPSNAMEIALPDKNEILLMLDEMKNAFVYKISHLIQKKERELIHIRELLNASSPVKKLDMKLQECELLLKRFNHSYINQIQKKEKELNELKNILFSLSPVIKINSFEKEIELLKSTFKNKTAQIISSKEKELINLKSAYETLNPKKREKKGFAEITKNGKRIDLKELKIGDIFDVSNADVLIKSKALEKIEN